MESSWEMKPKPRNTKQWPRIRDLPERDRAPFDKWLEGQTRPYLTLQDNSDQDGYFPEDYDRWKRGRQIID